DRRRREARPRQRLEKARHGADANQERAPRDRHRRQRDRRGAVEPRLRRTRAAAGGLPGDAMNDAAHQWQERRLGRTILRTYRDTRDLYDVIPNERQPRMGPKEDLELQRQIEANEGIFEPLLVEPHPDLDGKYRIIDGDRRWTNSKVLVEQQKREEYRRIPL